MPMRGEFGDPDAVRSLGDDLVSPADNTADRKIPRPFCLQRELDGSPEEGPFYGRELGSHARAPFGASPESSDAGPTRQWSVRRGRRPSSARAPAPDAAIRPLTPPPIPHLCPFSDLVRGTRRTMPHEWVPIPLRDKPSQAGPRSRPGRSLG